MVLMSLIGSLGIALWGDAELAHAAAPATRSRTVEFFAGQHTGSTAANHNAQNNFAAQTYLLAETNADIADAYVEVSAQIGSITATTYASAHIYFDSCAPACTPTPTAFTTTGSLGANSGESQFIRFRAPVTSEADLAAYTGAGAARSFAVGYCFATGSTCSGTTSGQIYGASAKLVVTYTYDASSANETNTVLYPLESGADLGSRPVLHSACTMDNNCPTFSYDADIPDLGTQQSQWFRMHGFVNAASTTDQIYVSQVDGNTSGGSVHMEQALSGNGGWIDHLAAGLPGYANNTLQRLEYGTANHETSAMGGENVVTYTRSSSATVKTKTVTLPVGEVLSANGSTTKSALAGSLLHLPETGVSIQKAWFRVHASTPSDGSGAIAHVPLTLTSKVGTRSETAPTTYRFDDDIVHVGSDGYLNHVIPSVEYAELAKADASNGKGVQLAAQWGGGGGGAVSAELVVTYQYTDDSRGYLSTQRILAGQQTAAPSTTFATAAGAVNPAIPETSGITIRGASLETHAKNTGLTATEGIGSSLSTGSCTAAATSTAAAPTELSRFLHWNDVTPVLTNSDTQTYTACYVTAEPSVFSGTLTVTYQWSGPNITPGSPVGPTQQTSGGLPVATGGATAADNVISLGGSISDTDTPETLYLCVEVDAVGTAFSGIEDACSVGVGYSGSAVAATISRTLAPGSSYHWQARTKDFAGAYSAWLPYGGNAETEADFATPAAAALPGTRSRTVEFFAGQHTGSTAANHNAQNNFAAQTYLLAETNADIVDAYVEVSAQIGSITATTYASAHIYFDSCAPACTPTPTAFTTTGSLGANSGESQYIRFRAPVTSEADLAAYTGAGAARSFAVGYCFATGATCSGTTSGQIYGASAKLVVTYTYDASSANETNTVLYPLQASPGEASLPAAQPACTLDNNCPRFSYNAEIPDLATQQSQWFRLHTLSDTTSTTDMVYTPQVEGNASGGAFHVENANAGNGGWVDFYATGLAGYANNTPQQLEWGTPGNETSVMGGENVVTYTRSAAATTKTKTVTLAVGELITAASSTTKSALTGPTVYLPENGLTIQKAWFRVHAASFVPSGKSALMLSTKVGGRAETGPTTYGIDNDTHHLSTDGYLNHLIPPRDYDEMAAGAVTGKAVQLAAQWGATNPGGAVSAELVVTYQYTGEASGYLSSQKILAGQQTTTPTTGFSTATGALDPSIPEPTGVTIRGAWLETNAKNTGITANEAIGSSLSTGSCTATTTSTALSSAEITRHSHLNGVTATVLNDDAQGYTACYATTEPSVFSGTLGVTHQWSPPPNVAPGSPASLTQTTSGDVTIATGGTTSDTTVKFGATVSDPDNPDSVSLCVEVDVVGTAFSGTEDACSSGVAYSGSAVAVSISRTSAVDQHYHWQVRTKDAAGAASAWVSYGGNLESAIDFSISGNTASDSPAALSQLTEAPASLAAGAWHNDGDITFTASVSDPDASDTLALCVEIDALGTAFSGTEDACGAGVAYSGSAVTASIGRTLAAGQYHWQVRVKDAGGLYSAWVAFSTADVNARDVGVDLTAPGTGTVYDGGTAEVDAAFNNGTLTDLSGNWSGFADSGSGLASYSYAVGTTAGGSDVLTWTSAALGTSMASTTLSLATSVPYYLTVRAYDNAGNVTTVSSNGQQVLVSLGFTVGAVSSGGSCGAVTTTVGGSPTAITLRPLGAAQAIAGMTLNVTTNAANGYSVLTSYTGAPLGMDPARTYVDAPGTNANPGSWPGPGVEAFGYTTSSTTLSGVAGRFAGALWAAFSTTAYEVARRTSPTSGADSTCLAIAAAKAGNTPADTYSTTIRYTAVPAF